MNTPSGGIAGTGRGAPPPLEDIDPYVVTPEVFESSVCSDQGPRRAQVRLSIRATQTIDHQVASVVEPEAEPVPARHLGAKLRGSPLVVEPRRTLHRDWSSPDLQLANDLEPRPAQVDRSVSLVLALARVAAIAVPHQFALGTQLEVEADVGFIGRVPVRQSSRRQRGPSASRQAIPRDRSATHRRGPRQPGAAVRSGENVDSGCRRSRGGLR